MSGRDCLVALSIPLALACTAGEAQWAGTVTDSAGIQIVENTGQPLWPQGEGWTVREVLRIGAVDADPEYQFGQIGWLAPSSDGRIFVLDNQGQHVKVFTPGGEYARTIGKPGSGPGEIGPPQGGNGFVGVGVGDTVFVPDIANQRVNRWTADGTEAGSFPLNILVGFPMTWQMAPDGRLVEQVRQLNIGGGTGAAPSQHDVVVRLTSDGIITDTITSFPAGETIRFTGSIPEWTIYSPETGWSITDDGGLLLGTSNEYRLRQYDAAGTLQRIIAMPYEPRLVSEGDKEAVTAFFRKIFEDQPVPPAIAEQLIKNNLHFGEYLPAFAQAIGGPEGSIWVQHVRAASDMTDEQLDAANFLEDIGAADWDVLDHEGRYLGVVTMPERFGPRTIVGDKIYGVWRDDLDVQYVMVLEIVTTE